MKYKQNNLLLYLFRRLTVKLGLVKGEQTLRRFSMDLTIDLNQEGISLAIYSMGYREIDHVNLYTKILKGKFKVLDLGANIGYYTLLEAAESEADIVCIEPDPRNVQLLNKNVKQNALSNRVEVITGAVADKSGAMQMSMSAATNLNRLDYNHIDTASQEVRVYTLDELDEKYGPFDCLRMDVEGAETLILSDSARNFLTHMPLSSCLFFEVHPGHFMPENNSIIKTIDLLIETGFSKINLVSSGLTKKSQIHSFLGSPSKIFKDGWFKRSVYYDVDIGVAKKLLLMKPKEVRYCFCEKEGKL